MEISIFFILLYIAEALILYSYVSLIFHPRHKPWIRITFLFALYVLLLLASVYKNFILNIIAIIFVNLLFIFFMYRTKLTTALFHSIIITVTMGMTELIVHTLLTQYAPAFSNQEIYFRNFVLHTILNKLLYFFVLYGLSHFFIEKEEEEPQSRSTFFLLLVPVGTICVMITLFSICLSTKLFYFLDLMISISSIMMLFINILIFSFHAYSKKRYREFTKMQLLLQRESDTTEYYRMLVKENENQRILSHDIRKHLQTISVLNEHHESQKIDAYINQITSSSSLYTALHLCNNEILNIILCKYHKKCQEEQIDFIVDTRSGTIDFIQDNDITALFCNLLDNAVESAAHISKSYIELNVTTRENMPLTIISMTNSCENDPFSGNQLFTRKPDKLHHGYGIKSIQRVIDRYHGDMNMYYDAPTSTFHTIITLKHGTVDNK